MPRPGLIALALLVTACSSSLDIPAQRLVLLQYSRMPTSADSAAASQVGGGPVTIYPIILTMTITTGAPTSAFLALSPNLRITDGDNIAPGCERPSVFFNTNHLVMASDSAAAALAGIRVVTFSRNRTEFGGDFDRTTISSVLAGVGGLAADTNIAAVDLDLSGPCLGQSVSVR